MAKAFTIVFDALLCRLLQRSSVAALFFFYNNFVKFLRKQFNARNSLIYQELRFHMVNSSMFLIQSVWSH